MRAAEVHVIAGGGIAVPLNEITAEFQRAYGHKVTIRYGTAPELIRMAATGVAFDLGVVPQSVWKDATARALIVPATFVTVASVGIGVAVRAGAPKPDIGSVAAFKQALLQAHSVASIEASATGAQLADIYERLGISAAMKAKTKSQLVPAGIGQAIASGVADLALFTLNVLIDPRLDIVGPLPDEIQRTLVYEAGIAANSTEPQAATAFTTYLTSSAAAAVLKAKGMTPG